MLGGVITSVAKKNIKPTENNGYLLIVLLGAFTRRVG